MSWYADVSVWADMPSVIQVYNDNGEQQDYLPERTCKNKVIEINKNTPVEFRTDNFRCSECGELFCADSEGVNYPIDWTFCPNCGARVVCE